MNDMRSINYQDYFEKPQALIILEIPLSVSIQRGEWIFKA